MEGGNYNSLYRKYRPDTFEGIIGQEHIVKTLKNQIKRGTVGHAYLFTGTRGTGKTSTAKIFARAVNCLSPNDGSPCGECSVCRELLRPNNMDVIEIDAASNNGVDEIRDLREKINFRPAFASKKVYIIDEVHMLSPSAYNALLKTLEEPPEHVIFILATTEVQKIPATILSRCLRFDFKLIPEDLVAGQIAGIFTENGIEFEEAAVRLIAAAGGGSDRDSLSLADMCQAFSDGVVTYENVLEVLGAGDPGAVSDIAEAVVDGDAGRALSLSAEVLGLGKNVALLANDIAGVFRNAVFIKTALDAEAALKLPSKYFAKLKALADKSSLRMLIKALDGFSSVESELRYSAGQRIVFEAAVVKTASRINDDIRIDELEKRLALIERAIEQLSLAPGGASQKKNLNAEVKNVGSDVNAEISAETAETSAAVFGDGIVADATANSAAQLSESQNKIAERTGAVAHNDSAALRKSAVGKDTTANSAAQLSGSSDKIAERTGAVAHNDSAALWKSAARIVREASIGFLGIEMENHTAEFKNGELHVSVDENSLLLKRGNKIQIDEALKEAGFDGGVFFDVKEREDDGSVIAKLREDFGNEIKIII
ncbi:MAG: DNA polymerase III subunit gamma/tau [Clostridiales bacterium]|jgi:DNA polymerase-3 subunit gamma/tau|nr:DNA polymerase III subunit gamma/tau [Clostridiales bacterium]